MESLPLLKSGRIGQYPLLRKLRLGVDTLAFLDGSEQRCATTRPLHEWTLRFGLIDEQELNALEDFVTQQQGPAGRFDFTDPVDGIRYQNCSLELDVLTAGIYAPGRVMAQLVILENPN